MNISFDILLFGSGSPRLDHINLLYFFHSLQDKVFLDGRFYRGTIRKILKAYYTTRGWGQGAKQTS